MLIIWSSNLKSSLEQPQHQISKIAYWFEATTMPTSMDVYEMYFASLSESVFRNTKTLKKRPNFCREQITLFNFFSYDSVIIEVLPFPPGF